MSEDFTSISPFSDKKVKGKYVLMISDIRLSPDTEAVNRDNNLQRKWVKQLKPNYAQLKFRMPRMVKKYRNI